MRAVSEARYWLENAARRQEYDRTLAERESQQAEVNRGVNQKQESDDQGLADRKADTASDVFHRDPMVHRLARAIRAAGRGYQRGRGSPSPLVRPEREMATNASSPDRERLSAARSGDVREKWFVPNRDARVGCLGAIAIAAIAVIILMAYTGADQAGWMSHVTETTITVPGDWLVGEMKPCESRGADAFAEMDCGGLNDKQMRVTFWGRAQQPEYAVAYWNCTRNDDDFTCRETGGTPIQPQ